MNTLEKTLARWRMLASYFAVRKVRSSLDEYLDFVFEDEWGLFKPLQVRSELRGFLELVEAKRPARVLEIGTAAGGTLFLLARVASPDALLISLDLPYGAFGGGYSPIRIPIYRSFARRRQEVRLIRGDSHSRTSWDQVVRLLRGADLDCLFIDGDHTYEGVRKDFELYAPLVASGGIVALHDIARHPEGHGCDVERFWNEIRHDFDHREIVEETGQGWAGIGVISV